MSAYTPPTENLPVFNSSVFLKSADVYITQSYADLHYIQYTSTQAGIVNFNAILSLNNGIVNNTNNTNSVLGYNSSQSLGLYNTAYGYETLKNATSLSDYNTAYGYESLNATTGSNNSSLGANTGLINVSGSNNTYVGYGADADGDYVFSTAIGSGSIITKSKQIILGRIDDTITIPNSMEVLNGGISIINAPSTGDNSIIVPTTAWVNTAITNAAGFEFSTINTTTTGTTNNLTFATDALKTILNTPSTSGRIFVLPTPSSPYAGYWFAFCNKSTANTIAIQYPSGTLIATIPVATNATNGGSTARFAVFSSGTTYFRVA